MNICLTGLKVWASITIVSIKLMNMDYENKATLKYVMGSLKCWTYHFSSPLLKLYQTWLGDEVNVFYAL